MIRISPSELLAFQIDHYQQRLKEETRIEVRSWLRNELFNLKKRIDV